MRRSRVFVATAAAALVAIQASAQGVPRLDSYEGVAVRIIEQQRRECPPPDRPGHPPGDRTDTWVPPRA